MCRCGGGVVVDTSTFGGVVVMADTPAVLRFDGVVVASCWRDGGDGRWW